MAPERFSRRNFLGGSAKLGLGAASVAVAGAGSDLLGAAGSAGAAATIAKRRRALEHSAVTAGGLTSPPPAPPGHWNFVSRPDLRPPGVSLKTATGYSPSSLTPRFIFTEPREIGPGSMPAGSQRGLMILDRSGSLIWFKPLVAKGEDPLNFRVQSYKGNPVLTWWQGIIGPGYGEGGIGVLMDASYKRVTTVTSKNYPMDLHELLLTPEGTALMTAYETGSSITIGHAQEIDIATGALVFDWASYPAVRMSESYVTGADYFHLNSIDVWPGSARNLLISARNTCTVYLVQRSTKKILWRLHGKHSNFFTNQQSQFWYQHDARALANGSGISVFDDASQPCPENQSWAKVIHLDMATRGATLAHEYRHSTSPIDAGSQGNCQILPDGSHFVGWGAPPYFSQFAPAGSAFKGALVVDGRFPDGVESYRSFSFDWVGKPSQNELALVVKNGSKSGEFTAYVSWNGATEVRSWHILAGTSDTTLRHYASVIRRTFETVVPVTYSGATQFRAKAYDKAGQLLGSSAIVAAG